MLQSWYQIQYFDIYHHDTYFIYTFIILYNLTTNQNLKIFCRGIYMCFHNVYTWICEFNLRVNLVENTIFIEGRKMLF